MGKPARKVDTPCLSCAIVDAFNERMGNIEHIADDEYSAQLDKTFDELALGIASVLDGEAGAAKWQMFARFMQTLATALAEQQLIELAPGDDPAFPSTTCH